MTLTTEPLNDSRLPRWKTRIVTKFLLLALPFFIVISFTWLTFAPRWYRNLALKHLEDKAESMGEIAAYSLAPAIVFEDIKNIKEIITNISQSREIEYILVFDAKGRELYQYFKSPSVRPTKQQMKLTGLSSDGQIWNLYTEIRHREETVGYLALGFSLRHMEAQVSLINRLILITSGIIFLLGILTLYALSLLITRPLRKMARTVEDISRGNLDQRIEIKTHDEVGQLARMFNSTLDELQKVMRHLQEAKDNLEKRVEERTAELKQQVEEKEALAQKLKESEELFRDIVETMGEAVVIVDDQENFLFANPAAKRIFNVTEEKLEGRNLREFTAPDQFELLRRQTLRRRQGFRDIYDLELTPPGGNKKIVIVNAAPRFDRQGNFIGALAVMTEITERKKETEDLAKAKKELETVLSNLEQRNKETIELVEMGESIALAKSEKEAIEIITSYAQKLFPEDVGLFYLRMGKANYLELVSSWNNKRPAEEIINLDDCWALRKSAPYFVHNQGEGFICPHLQSYARPEEITACLPLSSAGETIGLIVVLCCQAKEPTGKSPQELLPEMESRKQLLLNFAQRVALSVFNIRLKESLRQQSIRDPLTELYNRRYLDETLDREFARAKRANQPISIIMLDIDHFKKINDLYGHEAGDYALQVISRELQKAVRAEDIVCRFGGEEFTVVLPGLSLEKAVERAELILDSIRHLQLSYSGLILEKITLSAGIATYPEHGHTPSAVLQAADIALLRAKNKGRNQLVIAEKSSD